MVSMIFVYIYNSFPKVFGIPELNFLMRRRLPYASCSRSPPIWTCAAALLELQSARGPLLLSRPTCKCLAQCAHEGKRWDTTGLGLGPSSFSPHVKSNLTTCALPLLCFGPGLVCVHLQLHVGQQPLELTCGQSPCSFTPLKL